MKGEAMLICFEDDDGAFIAEREWPHMPQRGDEVAFTRRLCDSALQYWTVRHVRWSQLHGDDLRATVVVFDALAE